MTIEATTLPETEVTCANCEACCCRLEVMLISDTGVPDNFSEIDRWGGRKHGAARRWLVFGLGPKHDDLHDLREAALDLPRICDGRLRVYIGASRQSLDRITKRCSGNLTASALGYRKGPSPSNSAELCRYVTYFHCTIYESTHNGRRQTLKELNDESTDCINLTR